MKYIYDHESGISELPWSLVLHLGGLYAVWGWEQ